MSTSSIHVHAEGKEKVVVSFIGENNCRITDTILNITDICPVPGKGKIESQQCCGSAMGTAGRFSPTRATCQTRTFTSLVRHHGETKIIAQLTTYNTQHTAYCSTRHSLQPKEDKNFSDQKFCQTVLVQTFFFLFSYFIVIFFIIFFFIFFIFFIIIFIFIFIFIFFFF